MVSLDGFPEREIEPGTALFRIHRAVNDPWFFDKSDNGRFNAPAVDVGACHFAEQPDAAWLEVFRRTMLIAPADVTARRLCTIGIDRVVRLADLTNREARRHGVDASLSAGADYAESQAFAAAAFRHGFDGVRYRARHDLAQQLIAVALFEPHSGRPPWPDGSSEPITSDLIERMRTVFGYKVLPTP